MAIVIENNKSQLLGCYPNYLIFEARLNLCT